MSPRRRARRIRGFASPLASGFAALLACRPVGPVSPPPGGPSPGPDTGAASEVRDPGALTEPVPDPADATPDSASETAPETPGPGITVDAALQTQRVTRWDGAPHQLLYRPGSPGGWPDLPGRAVGVLWSVALYNGRGECVTRNPGDPVQYQFSRGPIPSYSLYFPSDGRGFNFIPQWIVPLPDGTTTKVDAALFRPDTTNTWGLHACAHLVELAVNAGRGGRGLHFIATDVRVLDGTAAFPWRLNRVLADLRARTRAHADAHRADLQVRASGPGPWTTQRTPGMLVTWLPETDQLEVIVWSTETRTATRTLGRETIRPEPCPPGSPCARRDAGTFEDREVQRETVDFAVRYELDRTARLLRETIYTPRQQSDTRTNRVQVHN